VIHFYLTFSGDVDASPFANKLRELNVSHKLFPARVALRYKSRLWLIAIGWPYMFYHAILSAISSLFYMSPRPSSIVVGSHIEAYVFGLLRLLIHKAKRPDITLLGFIYTKRKSKILSFLRGIYFRILFDFCVDKVICHSIIEVKRYGIIFPSAVSKFVYMPCGLYVPMVSRNQNFSLSEKPYILSAGRSGRDYYSLCKAVEGLPIDLHIVCDNEQALSKLGESSNVKILQECYDENYLFELLGSLFVVVPLSVEDISAGQMVIIQAMAYGKATVVTSTPTINEYVTNGEQSILVKKNSIDDLRTAIQLLLEDQSLIGSLGNKALHTYKNNFSVEAYVENLINCIKTPASVCNEEI
jgi:glycosyltransferase involved in cell wall biosynthesis